jgi:CheY-like chemotaxis protein
MARRVLVIDDLPEMHVLIRRTLSTQGYEVDGAATLAEALRMNPAGYDAVLVDARLGGESGADLIETLRSQDPAGARRCVLMTGGPTDILPAGVTLLAKPFQISDLLDAIVKVQRTAAASGLGAAEQGAPGHSRPEVARPGTPGAGTPGPGTHAAGTPCPARVPDLLRLIRLLRVQERRELAGYLHGGPIQGLTAASLELQLMRQSAEGSALGVVQAQVDAGSAALRWLVDGPWPVGGAGGPAADVIRQRTAWLLARAPEVTADLPESGPDRADPELIADVVELTLLAIRPSAPAAQTAIAVSARRPVPQVALTLTPGRSNREVGDWSTAQFALGGLASALGVKLSADFRERQWRVRLSIPER